jgi:hypothetical protein
MLPEAYEEGGAAVGVVTTAGVLVAFVLSHLTTWPHPRPTTTEPGEGARRRVWDRPLALFTWSEGGVDRGGASPLREERWRLREGQDPRR